MGLTKIVAERVMGVPYLQHVDHLIEEGVIVLRAGSLIRGDMVGLDRMKRWHAFEGKGRSNHVHNFDCLKAKAQVEHISTINGTPPETSNYCISGLNDTATEVLLADPEVKDDELQMSVNPTQFIFAYYDKIFRKMLNEPLRRFNVDNSMVRAMAPVYFKLNDYFILGALPEIIRGLEQQSSDLLFGAIERLNSIDENLPDNISMGSDGIILIQTREFELDQLV